EYIYIRNNPSVFRNLHITNRLGTSLDAKNTNTLGVTGFGVGSNLYTPGMSIAEIASNAATLVTAYDAA
ncbi:MAG: hypothetical protein ACPGC3_08070, partial [Paracoccaceae bacterium]